jgi:hypothetical protein
MALGLKSGENGHLARANGAIDGPYCSPTWPGVLLLAKKQEASQKTKNKEINMCGNTASRAGLAIGPGGVISYQVNALRLLRQSR